VSLGSIFNHFQAIFIRNCLYGVYVIRLTIQVNTGNNFCPLSQVRLNFSRINLPGIGVAIHKNRGCANV